MATVATTTATDVLSTNGLKAVNGTNGTIKAVNGTNGTTAVNGTNGTDKTNGVRKRPPVHIFETIEEPVTLRGMIIDDIYLLGGQFAILCQFAHPGIAFGTVAHSSFASRIPERLRNTARFLNASVFGTEREKQAIFGQIHRFHARVNGVLDGEQYDANDPELHKWTAATLFVSLVLVHERIFGKMDQEKMEAIYRESAVYGTSLRMPPEMWPETLEDFWAYWDHMIATLPVTPQAKKLSRDLLWPTGLPFNMQMLVGVSRVVTKQLLPPRLQKEYDLEPTALDTLQYQLFINGLSYLYPWVPLSVRSRRHNLYMRDLTAAVERIETTGHWGRDKDYPAR